MSGGDSVLNEDSTEDSGTLLRLLGDETSTLVSDLYARYTRWAEDGRRAGEMGKPVVKLSKFVRPEDMAYLTDTFPVFKFVNVSMPEATVVRMEAVRSALVEVLAHTDSWPGERVVHLNGPLVVNALKGRSYVHSCMSTDTTELHAQVVVDLSYLRRVQSYKPKGAVSSVGIVDQYCARGMGPCEYFCIDPVQCSFPAESIWVDHCNTNISLVQLAYVMGRHHALRAFGSIIYDPGMLELETGRLESIKAEWFVDKTNDTLTVVSLEDSQVAWSHSYSSWKQIVTDAGLFTDGHQFTWEVIAQYSCFFIYRFVKHEEQPEGDTLLTYKRWDSGGERRVKLTNYRLKVGADPANQFSWYPEVAVWPADLYEKIDKKAAAASEREYTMETLRRYLRDYNSTIIVSGVSVSEPKYGVFGHDADVGLTVIYLRNYKARYEAGKDAELIRNACKELVSLREAGLFKLGWLALSEKIRSGSVNLSDAVFRRSLDFDITPTVEYTTGCRTYEVKIPAAGQKPANLSKWKKVFNNGFFSPPVASSGLLVLEAFRKKTRAVQGVVAPYVRELVDSVSLVRLVESVPSITAANEAASNLLEAVYDLGVSRGFTTTKFEYDSVVQPKDDRPAASAEPLSDIQDVMDELFPELTRNPMSARSGVLHTTDQSISVNAKHNALNIAKMTLPAATVVAQPKLRAPVEGDRPQTGLETMIAFNKRNNDAPFLRNPTDPVFAAQDMWDYLEKGGFFADDYEQLIAEWNSVDGIVRPNIEDSDAWLNKASGSTISQLLAADISGVNDAVINVYQLMIKAQVKPKLEGASSGEYAALQTVVYHQKRVNALFSPLFVTLAQRFCRLLHPKVVVQMRKSTKDMQDAIRALVAMGGGYSGVRNFESDIGKFDKSQDHVALQLEDLVYSKLGLDRSCLATWISGCEYGEVASVAAGFRAFVAYQRKSGTGTTTIGNTIVNLFSVIRGFKLNIDNMLYAVFLGDDSVVGYRGVELDLRSGIDYMSSIVNLQVKAYDTEVGYICSQYIVPDGDGNVVLMSDPIKRMAMLGKPVKVTQGRILEQELEEKWVSFSDLMVNYDNPVHRANLNGIVCQRVGCPSILRGIEALSALRNDKRRFAQFWESKTTQIIV